MGLNYKNRNNKIWVPSSDHESEDNNDNETNAFLSPSGSMEYRRGLTYRASVVLPWILHAILIIGYLSIAVLWYRREQFQCFDGAHNPGATRNKANTAPRQAFESTNRLGESYVLVKLSSPS